MAIELSVHADVKAWAKRLDDLVKKQVPFATAMALNEVAKQVQKAERENMMARLDEPTPFTTGGVFIKRATKASQTAVVDVKPTTAAYLAPFETGGLHMLPGAGRTWFNPKDRSLLNKYGNLPRTKLATLKGRSDVFIGTVQTSNGERIDGVWQRPAKAKRTKTGKFRKLGKTANATGRLKLLLRFGDALPVRQHLDFHDVAITIIRKRLPIELDRALAKAIESAK
jgi:hypothetical protein